MDTKRTSLKILLAIGVIGICAVYLTSMLVAQSPDFNVMRSLTFSPSVENPTLRLSLQQHQGGDAIIWMPDGHSLQFKERQSGSSGDRITFTSDGWIGVGTTQPREALDVHGNIVVTGKIYDGSGKPLGGASTSAVCVNASANGTLCFNGTCSCSITTISRVTTAPGAGGFCTAKLATGVECTAYSAVTCTGQCCVCSP